MSFVLVTQTLKNNGFIIQDIILAQVHFLAVRPYRGRFFERVKKAINPYGNGDAAKKIVSEIKKIKINENLIKKVFIDNHEI